LHGQMGFKVAGFWTFMLLSVGLSLIITWVYLHSHRAILVGFLVHFTSNFTAQLVAPNSDQVEMFRAVLLLSIGLAGCIWLEHRARLTRQAAIQITNRRYT